MRQNVEAVTLGEGTGKRTWKPEEYLSRSLSMQGIQGIDSCEPMPDEAYLFKTHRCDLKNYQKRNESHILLEQFLKKLLQKYVNKEH